MKAKYIYISSIIILIITAFFSTGYNHFDEHFQVIEFAGLKLGLTEKANLPWEYKCMMRPAVQPLIVYSVYKAASVAGITNPFMVGFLMRLLSAMFTFVSIHMLIRMYAPGSQTGSCCIPSCCSRFSFGLSPTTAPGFHLRLLRAGYS